MNSARLPFPRPSAPSSRASIARALVLGGGALALVAPSARAQVTFSVDFRGPTITLPNTCDGIPITAGDILSPSTGAPCAANPPALGPLPPPTVTMHGGIAPPGLGLLTWGGCVGAAPGVPCPIEVDALSYGVDAMIPPGVPAGAGAYVFSVDEWAMGIAGSALAPAVWSESAPAFDSAADGFVSLALPASPLAPGGPSGNTALIDGNGLVSLTGAVYAGLGIFEPRPAFPGPGPRPGDNLDALDVDTPMALPFGVFFSLDAGFLDPLVGVPNTGSGPANGFPPAAILNKPAAAVAPIVWTPAVMLGLDLAGPGTDDLDALAMRENGIPGYQPGADFYLFSVRRGSAVIGMPDSIFGIPIEAGDLLVPPMAAGMPPGIYVAAEWIGLLTTRTHGVVFGDDVDALDVRQPGLSGPFVPFCTGDGSGPGVCPCGNTGLPNRGCNNSVSTGGAILSAVGMTAPDTVVLTSSGELPTAFSIFLQGTVSLAAPAVFGDGIRCVGGALKRLYAKPAVAGTVSAPTGTEAPITVRSAALGDPIAPGSTRYYQVYYRDPVLGFCPAPPGDSFNISTAMAITW